MPKPSEKKSRTGILVGAEADEEFDTPEKAYAEAERLIREAQATKSTKLTLQLTNLQILPPAIADLTTLRMLSLDSARVSDLTALKGLTALQELSLDYTGTRDLAPLAGLSDLRALSLDRTQITDLKPLSNLYSLRSLSVNTTGVTELVPLHGLTGLRFLSISGTPVADFTDLARLTALETLWLNDTRISDVAPLSKLYALRVLSLRGTRVVDLGPLSGLTALESLWLSQTSVSDLAPISDLRALEGLWLSRTPVTDVTPIAGLSRLRTLWLIETKVENLAPLVGLNRLIDGFKEVPRSDWASWGLAYSGSTIAYRRPFKKFANLPQPARTVETINYLRRLQGLEDYRPSLVGGPLESEQEQGVEESPPQVPPTRPAAIEPVWRDERLVLPGGALHGDLDKPDLDAALRALKRQIRALADGLEQEANIDRRTAGYLKKLSDDIPETTPAQHEFFALAHELEFLHGYAKTVTTEWPEFYAAKYHALVLSYDRTVKQFPKWNEFKRNAAKGSLTPENIAETPNIARAVVTELRTEDATAFVDETIPDAIENLAKPLDVAPSDYDIVDAIHDELAIDVLEGINNFLKRTVSAVLASWEFIERERNSAKEWAKGARDAFNKDLVAAGPNAGHAAFKWLRRIAKVAIAKVAVGASGIMAFLIATFPEQFAWLEPVLRFFGLL